MQDEGSIKQTVFLGVAGWHHPEWSGLFYPSDLPDDWALTFFNTQFSCVWLSYADWSQLEAREVATYIDDTHDDFVFLLEQPEVPGAGDEAVIKAFGSRLEKFCRRNDSALIWFGANPDVKKIAHCLRAGSKDQAVYLISENGDLAGIEQVRTLLGLLGV